MAGSAACARGTSLLAAAVALWCQTASAVLTEGQAGLTDWRQQYVGRAQEIHYDHANKRVILATTEGSIAAVGRDTGKIAWRQVLTPGQAVDRVLLKNSMLVSVSANGGQVQRWDVAKGHVVWSQANHAASTTLPESTDAWQTYVDATLLEEQEVTAIITLSSNVLISRRVRDGQAVWRVVLDDGEDEEEATDDCMMRLVSLTGDRQLMVFGTLQSKEAGGVRVVAKTFTLRGSLTDTKIVPLPAAVEKAGFQSCRIVGKHNLVCIGADAGSIYVLYHDAAEFAKVDLPGTVAFAGFAPGGCSSAPAAVLESQQGPMVVKVGEGKVNVESMAASNAVAVALRLFEDAYYVVSLTKQGDSRHALEYRPIDGDGAAVKKLPIDGTLEGTPDLMHARLFRRNSDDSVGLQSFFGLKDDTIVAIKAGGANPGKIAWTREEGLASIQDAAFMDLPASIMDAESMDALSRFMSPLMTIANTVLSISNPSAGAASESGAPQRDVFNTHKFILTVAASGKIFALDTESGAVVWQRQPISGVHALSEPKLDVIQPIANKNPVAVLIGKAGETTVIEPFNPLTGQAIAGMPVEKYAGITLVARGPALDETGAHNIVLLGTDQTVHTYPRQASAVSKGAQPLYVHTINKESGMLNGYAIGPNGTQSSLVAQERWSLLLDAEQETIVAMAFKHPGARVHSLGEILADRTVMNKYLNPNMIALATMTPPVRGLSTLSIYLIDSVRGSILHKVQHKQTCSGSVHMVQSANWIAYHYRNRKSKRYEIGMLELFDGSDRDPTLPFTSRDAAAPIVLRQAYVFPHPATSMSLTVTAQGVAETQILIGLPSGSIAAIHKRMLDARRPTNPKAAKHADGLMPYHPILMVPDHLVLNYNQTVERMQNVFVTPSGLESTCLVLATGLDVFFSHAMPSNKFDALSDDFPISVLSSALAGLAVLVYFIRQYSKDKVLRGLWK